MEMLCLKSNGIMWLNQLFELKERTNTYWYPAANTSVFWNISLSKIYFLGQFVTRKGFWSSFFVLVWFVPSQKTSLCTRNVFSSKKQKLLWLIESFWFSFIPLSANPTRRPNTLKQFVGNSQRIIWVCLRIFWVGI